MWRVHNSLLANKIVTLNSYYLKQCDKQLLLQHLCREVFPISFLENITSRKQQWRGKVREENFLKYLIFYSIGFNVDFYVDGKDRFPEHCCPLSLGIFHFISRKILKKRKPKRGSKKATVCTFFWRKAIQQWHHQRDPQPG